MFSFDFIKFAKRQKTFSWGAFGPPRESVRDIMFEPMDFHSTKVTDCVGGVLDHLWKELGETANAPDREARRFEWVDIIFLAMDGYMRDGGSPLGLALDMGQKQRINEQRKWPNWRETEPGQAIEHVRVPSEILLRDTVPVSGSFAHTFVGNGKRCDVCFAPREAEEHANTGGAGQGAGDETPQGV